MTEIDCPMDARGGCRGAKQEQEESETEPVKRTGDESFRSCKVMERFLGETDLN